jgi:hypothetical protein
MEQQVPWVELWDGVADTLQCNICKQYEGWGICLAFPDGIPVAVQTNKIRHTEVLIGEQIDAWVWEPVA